MRNRILILISLILIVFLTEFLIFRSVISPSLKIKEQTSEELEQIGKLEEKKTFEEQPLNNFEVIAQDLIIPWEIVFLPEGDLLITERSGFLKRIGKMNRSYQIEGVYHVGEGGLLGMALHPNFEKNRFLYLYFTVNQAGKIENRIERYVYNTEGELTNKKIILDKIPGANFHNGGRLLFGPDGNLYVGTGDAQNPSLAQEVNSLAGKILRITDNGTIPQDNPFRNAVWSLGHRNPQGLVFDDKGRLWESEHGATAYDELNLIEKGKNYGWPEIQGDQIKEGMVRPLLHSGPQETWAPSSLIYWQGKIFFVGLRGQSLYQVSISETGEISEFKAYLKREFGRLRALKLGADDSFYISTSNRDGRGDVKPGDDKIIRLDPKALEKR